MNIHKRILLHALRTAIIFITGFFIYEILREIEKIWNSTIPGETIYHFSKRKFYHFLSIFIIDLIILYIFFYLFDSKL